MDSSDTSQSDVLRLNKVPLGISLVFFGLELTALALILIFIMPLVLGGNPALLASALLGLTILFLAAGILSFVGKALCLTAPSDMGGRQAIYLAVLFDALAMSVNVISKFVTLPKLVASSSSLLTIIAFTCFLLFLEDLGRFLHDGDLTRKSTGLLKLWIVLVVSSILTAVCAVAMPVAVLFLAIVLIVLGLLAVIRYARLLLDFKRKLAPS